MSAPTWCAVVLCGGVGAVARAALAARAGGGERGTLLVNLTGTLALGVLTGAGAGGAGLLIAGTGFLGAYTTFSSWMAQSAEHRGRALAVALSVPLAAGLAAAALGRLIGGLA